MSVVEELKTDLLRRLSGIQAEREAKLLEYDRAEAAIRTALAGLGVGNAASLKAGLSETGASPDGSRRPPGFYTDLAAKRLEMRNAVRAYLQGQTNPTTATEVRNALLPQFPDLRPQGVAAMLRGMPEVLFDGERYLWTQPASDDLRTEAASD